MNNAFMSIKHNQDLLKIRPLISFIVDNYDTVFTNDLQSQNKGASATSSSSKRSIDPSLRNKKNADDKVSSVSLMGADSNDSGDFISRAPDYRSCSRSGSIGSEDSGSSASFHSRPNLQLHIPIGQSNYDPVAESGGSSNAPFTLHGDFDLDSFNNSKSGSGPSYSETEWRILETLIFSKVCTFIDGSSSFSQQSGDVLHHKRKSNVGDSTSSPPHKNRYRDVQGRQILLTACL